MWVINFLIAILGILVIIGVGYIVLDNFQETIETFCINKTDGEYESDFGDVNCSNGNILLPSSMVINVK